MDPATPVAVAKGALATSLAAGSLTAIHALYKGSPHPTPLAFSASANGGIAGAVFFGLREAFVSPLLQNALPHSSIAPEDPSSSSQASWTSIRTHRLLDSALSGALTGGILNSWQHGRARLWGGARTGAIICSILQLGFNELSVMRVKLVSQKIQESRAPPVAPVVSPDVSDKAQRPLFDRLMSIIGFHKLSDEEYLQVLKKQRDEALARIAVLEEERRERDQFQDDQSNPS